MIYVLILQSAFKPPFSIWSQFYGLQLVYCRKRKGQWFSQVTKEVGNRRVVNSSKSRPHEERLVRRICGYQTLFVLRLNHKGLHQTFSCIVAWDLANTLRAFEAGSFEGFLPMAAERYHVLYSNSSTWALEFDTAAKRCSCLLLPAQKLFWRAFFGRAEIS